MVTLITLRNDFHRSSVRLRVADDGHLTWSQQRRCRRVLCGAADCTCADIDLGTRGPQADVDIVIVGWDRETCRERYALLPHDEASCPR